MDQSRLDYLSRTHLFLVCKPEQNFGPFFFSKLLVLVPVQVLPKAEAQKGLFLVHAQARVAEALLVRALWAPPVRAWSFLVLQLACRRYCNKPAKCDLNLIL